MPDKQTPPVLNPVLRLLTPKRPTPPHGGGKSRKDINADRLNKNRKILPKLIENVKTECPPSSLHAGRLLIHTLMYEDRLRPTLTPDDIFDSRISNVQLVTSTPKGYLVETSIDSLETLKNEIITTTKVNSRVDISSIESIYGFFPERIFTTDQIDTLWQTATTSNIDEKRYKSFSLWLMPFASDAPKQAVAGSFFETVQQLVDDSLPLLPSDEKRWKSSAHDQSQLTRIKHKLSDYLSGKNAKIPVRLTSKKQLNFIVASGTICRIDPVTPPRTSVKPGLGKEPTPPNPNMDNSPTVAIVDGGVSSKMYHVAIAWKPNDAFVPKHQANQKHGNQVASLVVNATGWNNNLNIPDLPCRIAPVQVVPKDNVTSFDFDEDDLLEYLDEQMEAHPETKIWNFSFNQEQECKRDEVSSLGDGINKLARKHNILPIISAGNRLGSQKIVAPPADCESALVVSGRKHSAKGSVSEQPCEASRCGLGPHDTLRPDVSFFSNVRVIGGDYVTGTSYAAPLISRLAAHTYANLRHPSPDLVKAILLNNTELPCHDFQLGWGSPIRTETPWSCPDGVVTLAWTSKLESGQDYHWNNIYVPPSMMKEGKIQGEILLSAVLKPRINNVGVGQYFLSRLETGIQCVGKNGDTTRLVEACKTNGDIGQDGAKWNPTRIHRAIIPQGKACPEGKIKLRARVYLRDKFSLTSTIGDNRLGIISDVAFALTFICTDKKRRAETYDGFVQLMKNAVESAVIEQDIQLKA